MLAWGPPHNPYNTAPEKYRTQYDPAKLTLRSNVPPEARAAARKDLAGYYAHCAALDDCMGELLRTLEATGEATNTIVIFTSDHGDMLGSQAMQRKQRPYDESTRVPLLMRLPPRFHVAPARLDAPINSEDLMPTILSLCGVSIPKTVEGLDYTPYIRGGAAPGDGAALITCVAPFGEWTRKQGGREYRGLRTKRYTYVRDLNGPWLLFDNQTDPCQATNLANQAAFSAVQKNLEALLAKRLLQDGDAFLPGEAYIKKWGYQVDATGTMPYKR